MGVALPMIAAATVAVIVDVAASTACQSTVGRKMIVAVANRCGVLVGSGTGVLVGGGTGVLVDAAWDSELPEPELLLPEPELSSLPLSS